MVVTPRPDAAIDPGLVQRRPRVDTASRGTAPIDLVALERTVRRALVARNGVELGCEAAAEAIAWAVEHPDRLAELEQPAGYLYRVGQSRLRRQRRWARQTAPVFAPPADDVALSFDRELFDALADLRPEQRTAVVLVHCYGYRYREVAEVLGIGEAAVTNHVHRGLARLRSRLEDR